MVLLDQFLNLVVPLAWPTATVIIAIVFRRDIGQAMGRVGRVKYRDFELTFGEDLHLAEQMSRAIPSAGRGMMVLEAAIDGPELPTGRLISPIMAVDSSIEPPDLAENGPREMIEAAWDEVARASKVRGRMASAPAELVALVKLLKSLRDRAARSDQPPPSLDHARRFVELAGGAASRFKDLG